MGAHQIFWGEGKNSQRHQLPQHSAARGLWHHPGSVHLSPGGEELPTAAYSSRRWALATQSKKDGPAFPSHLLDPVELCQPWSSLTGAQQNNPQEAPPAMDGHLPGPGLGPLQQVSCWRWPRRTKWCRIVFFSMVKRADPNLFHFLGKVKTMSMKWWPVYVIVCALQDQQTVIPLQVAEDAWGVEEQDVLCLKLQEQFKFLTALLISFCGSRSWEKLLQWSYLIQSDLKEKQKNIPKPKCFALV